MNSINLDLTCPSYDLTSEYGSDGSANLSFNQMQVPDGGIVIYDVNGGINTHSNSLIICLF